MIFYDVAKVYLPNIPILIKVLHILYEVFKIIIEKTVLMEQ